MTGTEFQAIMHEFMGPHIRVTLELLDGDRRVASDVIVFPSNRGENADVRFEHTVDRYEELVRTVHDA